MTISLRFKVAEKIKILRKKQKLTQQQLADLAEIEYKYIQRIEGKNPPNLGIETLEKIAKALKTTVANITQ